MSSAQDAHRTNPRISVNDLALFIITQSNTAKIGIIRRAKTPSKPPIIRYKDSRLAICAYLTDRNHNLNHLVSVEASLKQRSTDAALSALARDDALKSIEVLHDIQRMSNQLAQFDFRTAPKNQGKLSIQGVEISVRADLLVLANSQVKPQFGAAILRMTQDDADTESAKARRREMGLFVATIARLHADQNLRSNEEVANRLCMSIDVQHGEFFAAPNSNTKRMNEIDNACLFIAAMWDRL